MPNKYHSNYLGKLKYHYATGTGYGSLCGVKANKFMRVIDVEKVTCKTCLKKLEK